MDTTDPFAYIERVKRVVADQLHDLDDSAEITNTHYFNHSAVPDFVITWPGERGERRIYLRDSYESIAAGHDGRYLTEGDPVLLSLEEPDPRILLSGDAARLDADRSERMLVTDVEAVELIGESDREEGGPLTQMIRANFVRGARGRIDRPIAQTLVETPDAEPSKTEGRSERSNLIAANFFADAAFRITRTANLVEAALRDEDQAHESPIDAVSGRLSIAEIRNVLPWLLGQPRARNNRAFWRRIGQMMTLADLEKIRDSLTGLDLTPLIRANSGLWEGKWGYMGVSTPIEGDETYEQRRGYWSFQRGSLGIDIGDQRLSIAANGQLMPKSRAGSSSATWEDLQVPLADARLSRVDLTGVRRSVTVTAEQSPDVRSDVQEVAASLEDYYLVSQVTIRVPGAEGKEAEADVNVDFRTGLLAAPGGASVENLVRIGVEVLGYRSQSSAEEIAGLTGD